MGKLSIKVFLSLFLISVFISGCTSIRFTPFISDNQLKRIRLGDGFEMVRESLGAPILQIQPNESTVVWEYAFRYRNNVIRIEPHSLSEMIYKDYFRENNTGKGFKKNDRLIFSGKTDHSVFLTFEDKKLIKIMIGNQIFTN